ncbi:PPOX class F420-dependent oxidoreductase [Rugosimonospora africana]|uniref:PPOX class F420-dependent oxidoreductase n=1 Tax=Rugosimonospora africana TaxID=556532 RepID=UPI001EF39CF6|nr:PPOX class F420-dependent oxidoreductase [Rugosimonospora africana]
MTDALEGLSGQRYISLTTYRRDGTAVATPVWLVRDGDRLAVWTNQAAGKVKRIRREPSVTVAACTVRGRLLGEPVAARAHVLEAADTVRIIAAIRKKYRFQGWLVTLRARRRPETTVGIAIEPVVAGPATS